MRKHSAQDDKKLQSILKKLQVTPVTGVEEVNLFKDDGTIIHFASPKGVDIKDLVLYRAIFSNKLLINIYIIN